MSGSEKEIKEEQPTMKRRDILREIEAKVQKWWEDDGEFNAEVDPTKEKFFVCFPFPYMNGRLHLGHAYSLTKADFTAGYQRLKGKNVLFPFGFHCTGMPIQGAATKLRHEIETFGIPPTQRDDDDGDENDDDKKHDSGKVNAAAKVGDSEAEKKKEFSEKFRGKKSKQKSKSGDAKLQWEIMEMLGIPEEEIPKFQDPVYWLDYFTPLGERDLKKFGLPVDWRRSFITTSENKFFDRFVRWQFRLLKEKKKIQFGQRPTIYSPIDKQACTDHDRASGEGVLPQEYTLIKLRVIKSEENEAKIGSNLFKIYGDNIFLVAATLRPETMYGQTNCFILPDGDYLAVEMNNNEVFICSDRSAKNMSYQNLMPKFGVVNVVSKFKGKDLVGVVLSAPKAKYEKIYTLPLLTISMKKGTGVVTSVPSDAPDDYAALRDWQTDAKLREKYGVKSEWVDGYDVVPIINIPGYGDKAAVTLCDQHKVKSQKDKVKLAEIKAEVYKKGFYEGTMICGKNEPDIQIFGKKVCDVKDIVKNHLVKINQALIYYEPENEVMSRSGDECVVTYLDQWYIEYGEEKWKKKVKDYVNSDKFSAFYPAALKSFNDTLEWLTDWACSRSFGLGTKVPWDEQFVIESLSDSTIYMAYYTINYMLQGRNGGSFTGHKGSPIGLDITNVSETTTNLLFDYIYLGKRWPNFGTDRDDIIKELGIRFDDIETMKREFEYWYPFDLRTSGKDLIKNHLTMCLYNHAAIWDTQPELWPKSFFVNGQIMIEAIKMSKSVGNFIMLTEAIEGHREANIAGKETLIGWCADATRFTCADAGDTLEDSNFSCDTANAVILRLTTELEFIKNIFCYVDHNESIHQSSISWIPLRDTRQSERNFFDRSFLNKIDYNIKEAGIAYDNMRFRDVLKFGFYNMLTSRDTYRDACAKMGIDMDKTIIQEFILKLIVVISPVCKHWSEYIWRQVLNNTTSITRKSWPAVGEINIKLMRTSDFLEDLIQSARKSLIARKSKLDDESKAISLKIYINSNFPQWKMVLLDYMAELYDTKEKCMPATALKSLKQFCGDHPLLKSMLKNAMQVGAYIIKKSETEGSRSFENKLLFDQMEVLKENSDYVTKAIGVTSIEIVDIATLTEAQAKTLDNNIKEAEPGTPTYEFI